MFSDFYEKFSFKKTTPEEKKEVVKNTGDWFPAQHDNKIKGMEDIKVSMSSGEVSLAPHPARKGYVWKKCLKCGKIFESYRNTQKYCSEECRAIADKENKERYEEKKKEKMNGKYKNCKECGKVFMPKHHLQKYCCGKCAKDAENERQRAAYAKLAKEGKTPYQMRKSTEAIARELNPVAPVAPQETMKCIDESDELNALEVAIKIVRLVKGEQDVKLAVDTTYKIVRQLLSK